MLGNRQRAREPHRLPVGTLPVRMRRGEAHVFVIEARGYERREIPVTPERDLTIPAELRVAR